MFRCCRRSRFYFAAIVAIFVCLIEVGGAKPVVIISIDAETVELDNINISLPEQTHLKIDGVACGISKIMEICDKYNVKSTFFYNVYEYKAHGEPAIGNIAKLIDGEGHDIQLHTHPQWAYDKNRNLMFHYSLEEQIKIIKEGDDLIKKWTNKKTLIHRAGAYGANPDTLQALRENGIFFDSSFFINYYNCRIQDEGFKANYITEANGLFQIPINVFIRNQSNKLLSFMSPVSSMRKYDVDWINYQTFANAIDAGIENSFDCIVLFLHSFTFIEQYNSDAKIADHKDIQCFDDILNYIVNTKKLKVETFASYINKIDREKLRASLARKQDVIPSVDADVNILMFVGKKIGLNKNNIQEKLYLAFIPLAIFAVIFVTLFTRKVNKKSPQSQGED